MNGQEKITDKLKGKRFKYKDKIHTFVNCKPVSGYIMVTTDQTVIQVLLSEVDNFLMEIEEVTVEVIYQPAVPVKPQVLTLETPNVFTKLNASFESLISQIDGATDENLHLLEAKAKMLTSLTAP